jgi:dipeptidyl-peptidase-4
MRLRFAFFLAVLFSGIPFSAWSQKPLTVEDIFGTDLFREKTLRGVEWVPQRAAFTFLEKDSSGKNGITLVDAESGGKTVLLDPTRMEFLKESRREKRFTLPNYFWSPDGKGILIPSDSRLFFYDVKAGCMRAFGDDPEEERDPSFSPDGGLLAYVKNGNLAVLNLSNGREIFLTSGGSEDRLIGRFDWVYEEEFFIRTGFAWSPDSKRIAFFELNPTAEPAFPLTDFLLIHNKVKMLRYPKAGDANALVRIGVVSAQGGPVVWMDLGAEKNIYIPRITWLKNGQRIAIQRLNRKQNRLDLLFADASTGMSRLILSEEDPSGWVDANDDLVFLEDGKRFVWSSERSNWKHLTLFDLEGKSIRDLTGGNWNVEAVTLADKRGRWLYFTASEKSDLETHFYRVGLDGREFTRLSTEDGTHRIRMSWDGRYYLDTFSNITTPDRTVLRRNDGRTMRVMESGEIEALGGYALARASFFTLRTEDGLDLNAYLLKPVDFDSTKKYPVLVFTYGGPSSQTVRNAWRQGGAGMGSLWHQMMLQKGYLVFCVDNRGTANKGNDFMNLVYGNMGMGVEDQIRGVKYLRTLAYVDGNRIGIYGWSGGGWMTCLALTRGAPYFKAGAAVAPVTDLRNYDSIWTERYMGLPQENPEGYDRSNPIHFIDRYQGGLFLIHGANDDNVHLSNTMQMARALEDAGKPFQMMIYPGKDHSIRGKETQVHLYRAMTDFFLKNL